MIGHIVRDRERHVVFVVARRMVDRRNLAHRVSAGRAVDRERQDVSRALKNPQIAIALQRITEADRSTGGQISHRTRAVRTVGVRQRPAGVGRVGVVANAAGIAARQRIVVELHRSVRRNGRCVVVDIDDNRACRAVAVVVGDLVADGERDVVLVAARRMVDRRDLAHRVSAGRAVDGEGKDVCRTLHNPQIATTLQRVAEASRSAGGQVSHRTRAIRTVGVRQRAAGVGRVGVVANSASVAARQRVVVELDRRIGRNRRRVVVDIDDDRASGAVAVMIGHIVRDRERHVVFVVARRMVDRRNLAHRVSAGRAVDRERQDVSRALKNPQIAIALQRITEADRSTGGQISHRTRAVRTVGVRQRPAGVGRVGVVANAAGIAARQRIVVELHRSVRRNGRCVVVDIDDNRACRAVAVVVGDLVADGERDVVLVAARRMVDRRDLAHRVSAGRAVDGEGKDVCRTLHNPQIATTLQRVAEASRSAGGQVSHRTRAIRTVGVRQRAAGVGRVGVVANPAGIAAGQRVVVELHASVGRDGRRVVVDADRDRAVGDVGIRVRHSVVDRERLVVLVAARRMVDRRVLDDAVGAGRRIDGHRKHRHAALLDEHDARAARDVAEARRSAGELHAEG